MTIFLFVFSLAGCSVEVPCAKTVWGEPDGSYQMRVIYDREECIALSDDYSDLANVKGMTPSDSVEGRMTAIAYLMHEENIEYLRDEGYIAALQGKAGMPFPSFPDGQPPLYVQVSEVNIKAYAKGGYNMYMLGDIGVYLADPAEGPKMLALANRAARNETLTGKERALLQSVSEWSRIVKRMKKNGTPAEGALLRDGRFAVVARKAPSNSDSNRNIPVLTLDGETKIVNVDYLALVVMPGSMIDLPWPRSPTESR